MWYTEIDFYLLKPLIKVFIKAGVLSDLGRTVDYPKKLVLGSIFKTSRSNEIGPRFVKTGPNGLYCLPGSFGAVAI